MTIFILVLLILFGLVMFLYAAETCAVIFCRMAPQVPSRGKLRAAVIAEIRRNYPNARAVIDLGSGWGGMARRIAREFPNMRVTGIEIMPFAFACSWVLRAILGPRNCRFIFGDAVGYLDRVPDNSAKRNFRDDNFDIAVCYSSDKMMTAIAPAVGKCGVLMSLDFPLPDRAPLRIVKLNKDYLGRHALYVYELVASR